MMAKPWWERYLQYIPLPAQILTTRHRQAQRARARARANLWRLSLRQFFIIIHSLFMGSDYSGSMPLPAYQIRFGLPHHVAAYMYRGCSGGSSLAQVSGWSQPWWWSVRPMCGVKYATSRRGEVHLIIRKEDGRLPSYPVKWRRNVSRLERCHQVQGRQGCRLKLSTPSTSCSSSTAAIPSSSRWAI